MEQLIRELAHAVTSSNALVASLTGELRDASTILGVLQRDMTAMVTAVRGDGNGMTGLLARTREVERMCSDLHGAIDSIKANCSRHFDQVMKDTRKEREDERAEHTEMLRSERAEALEHLRGRYGVIVALCGGSSVVGSLLVLFLAWLLGVGAK
jgi:hypothetical protein